jgi:ABC-type nitrate/sulfonate/bicarbonate transport system substrate-binding protein
MKQVNNIFKKEVLFMANKITKREMFEAIKAVEAVANDEAMVAFIDHEIELLDKKSANKKPSKTQEANEAIKAVVLDTLGTEPITVSELLKANEAFADMSNQKMSALLRQLVEAGKVVKSTDKKKSLFAIAE